jgi:hypothetical protein
LTLQNPARAFKFLGNSIGSQGYNGKYLGLAEMFLRDANYLIIPFDHRPYAPLALLFCPGKPMDKKIWKMQKE